MPKIRLNLSTLRARCLPAIKQHTTPGELLSKDATFVLNRREMLGTMAALGAMPVVKSVGTTVLGAVTMKASKGRIVFSMRGKERWVIDTKQFGGRPQLSVDRTESAVTIGLRGAFFPGTGLPADFNCTLAPAVKGWTMHLAMANGFQNEGPFEPWLLHLRKARSPVSFNHRIEYPHGNALLHLKGKASVTFWPDWTLQLQRSNIASIKLSDSILRSDRVAIRLADAEGASLFQRKIQRRTLLELERGNHTWQFTPALTQASDWDFTADTNAFDRARLETGQSQRGRMYQAIVLEGSDEAGNLRVKPAPVLKEFDGQQISLSLRQPIFAQAYSPEGSHAALHASFATAPTWIHLGQHSLLIGDDGENPGFEMVVQDGKLEQLSCRPALLSTLVPPKNADVIVHPIATSPGTNIAFSTARRLKKEDATGNLLHVKDVARNVAPKLILADLKVQMIRPEDFLTLGFEFYNIQLEDGGDDALDFAVPGGTGQGIDGPKLIAGGNAYMVVHFPPQHIQEEVFPETQNNTITPKPPPVAAMFAGQSRLAFKVPAGTVMPYTLEGLLDACQTLQMNLAANARAPEIELNVGIFGGIFGGNIGGLAQRAPFDNVPAVRGAVKALRAQNNTTINQQLNQRFGQEVGVVRQLPADTGERSAARAQRLIGQRRDALVAKTSPLAKAVIRESEVQAGAHLSIQSSSIQSNANQNSANQNSNFAVSAGGNNQAIIANPAPKAPSPIETAIEAPFRMYLSPNEYAGWTHASLPKSSDQTGRTELWHSRMGIRYKGEISEEDFDMKSVRAIWADDYNPQQGSGIGFPTALDATNRREIVDLSSNFTLANYEPKPVKAHQLMLSSLGAWLHVRGAWNPPAGISLSEWVNRGTMGRDHYVKVVEEGFLFPFGNAAAKVEITERKFQIHPNDDNARVAYLRKREFIIVREPEKVCGMFGTSSEQRQMPFKRVELVTTITSLLDPTNDTVFWPKVDGDDFLFNIKMEDIAGEVHDVTMPLAFIMKAVVDQVEAGTDEGAAGTGLTIKALRESYSNGSAGRNKHVMGGQSVTFTPTAIPGDTTFETVDLEFTVNQATERPFFAPVVYRANLVVPAVKHLLGDNAPDGATQVSFASAYLNHGFSSDNQGEVFFDFLDDLGLNFDGKGEQSGGLIKPNMDVKAFSRKTGPVGGQADTFSGGQFNPEEFFSSNGDAIPVPMLFGVVKLWDIIEAVGLDDLDKIPKVVTEALDVVEFFLKDAAYFEDALQSQLQNAGLNQVTTLVNDFKAIMDAIEDGDVNALPDPATVVSHIDNLLAAIPGADLDLGFVKDVEKRLNQFREFLADGQEFIQLISNFLNAIEMAKEMKVRLEWRPKIKSWAGIFVADKDGVDASMVLGVELRAKAGSGSGQPTAEIFCSLDNFTIDLYIIKALFSRVQFFATTGKKWGVDVVFDRIEFDGPLKWVEKLRELIPMDGFSDPPYVDIDTSGITAGFTQPIPSVAFGVFTVQNISLGAEINIPFIGDPATIQFNFNTRENPCTVTVMAIGGSFYFGITFDMEGLRSVEAAIEFGASIAFSIAVASGGVTLMAGIYFKYDGVTDEVTLTGYLRLSGHVSVLGLIGISLELRMELTYQSSGGKVIGRASVKVEIELLFFSIGVEITVERKFAGSNEDPTFLEQMGSSYIDPVQDQTVEAWPEYCMAFAE